MNTRRRIDMLPANFPQILWQIALWVMAAYQIARLWVWPDAHPYRIITLLVVGVLLYVFYVGMPTIRSLVVYTLWAIMVYQFLIFVGVAGTSDNKGLLHVTVFLIAAFILAIISLEFPEKD